MRLIIYNNISTRQSNSNTSIKLLISIIYTIYKTGFLVIRHTKTISSYENQNNIFYSKN